MLVAVQPKLPGLPHEPDQQLPDPLQPQQQEQPSSSLFPSESWENKMLLSGQGRVVTPALKQHQEEQQRRVSWQRQNQHEVERWRQQQQVQVNTMPQLNHRQRLYQPLQQRLGKPLAPQHDAWESNCVHPSTSSQECQLLILGQQDRRDTQGQDFFSVQHSEQDSPSTYHVQEQRHPGRLNSLLQPSPNHSAKEQLPQLHSKVQQQQEQQYYGKRRDHQQPQLWQVHAGSEQQQDQQQGYDCTAQSHLLAVARARRTQETAGQRLKRAGVDVPSPVAVPEAHTAHHDWAAFSPKKQHQQQFESGMKQQLPMEQGSVLLHGRHPEAVKQEQLLLDVQITEPLTLLESYGQQPWVLEQQRLLEQQQVLKENIAQLQQQPTCQRHRQECLLDKDGCAGAVKSAGSGESPVSPRNSPVATVVALILQEEHSCQKQQKETKKQHSQQNAQMCQASLLLEQQQKPQLQPPPLQQEIQQHQTQLQPTSQGESLQPHAEPLQLPQLQQSLQRQRPPQEVEQPTQKILSDMCNALNIPDSSRAPRADVVAPLRGATASEECENVHLDSATDSLPTHAGDGRLPLNIPDSSRAPRADVVAPLRGATASEECENVHLDSATDSLPTHAGDGRLPCPKDSSICGEGSNRRSSLYIPYKSGGATAAAPNINFTSTTECDQHTSNPAYSETANDSDTDARTHTSAHYQKKNFSGCIAKASNPVHSRGDCSSGCGSTEGREKGQHGSVNSSREDFSCKYSATSPCIGNVFSQVTSAFDGRLSHAEVALQHAPPSDSPRGAKVDCRRAVRGKCEQRAKSSSEPLSREGAVNSSRKSSSGSSSCNRNTGWQSRARKVRSGLCERNSWARESDQSPSCSKATKIYQCHNSRRCYKGQIENSRASGHSSRSSSILSYRSDMQIYSTDLSSDMECSRNSRPTRSRQYSIKRTGKRSFLSDARRCRTRSCSTLTPRSSSGDVPDVLTYGNGKSEGRVGGMDNKQTLIKGRERGSRTRKRRRARGSRGRGMASNGSTGESSGSSRKASATVMRNYNMLLDILTGEDEKGQDAVGLRVTEEVRGLSKPELQRGQRHRQEQHDERRQQHQRQHRHGRQQRQGGQQQVQRGSQQSQYLFVGKNASYSSAGMCEKESVALQVLDPCAHSSPSVPDRKSSGSGRSSLLRLASFDRVGSDSSFTGDGKRSNRRSSKSNCGIDSDCVANTSSENISCLYKLRNSSGSLKKGSTCSRGTRETGASGSDLCDRRSSFALPSLQDVKPSRIALNEYPDTKHKHRRGSSSARRGKGDGKTTIESPEDTCSGNMPSTKSGRSLVTGFFFKAGQQQQQSSSISSRAADDVMWTATHRWRGARSSCGSSSPKQQSVLNGITNPCGLSSILVAGKPMTCKTEFENRQVQNCNGSSDRHAVLRQQQREAEDKYFGRGAEEFKEKKLSRFRDWAINNSDVLPDAWIGEHINAVAMAQQRNFPKHTDSSICSSANVSGGLFLKRSGSQKSVRVSRDVAEAAVCAATLPATTTVDGAASGVRAAPAEKQPLSAMSSGVFSPVARGPEAFSQGPAHGEPRNAPIFKGATPAAVSGGLCVSATAPAVAAEEEMRETAYLLQKYSQVGDAAQYRRQEHVKAAIRQQLLLQYSSVLQQLQQHKAAAQLVEDESEPLRAALVQVVAAEAQLRKLQHSE